MSYKKELVLKSTYEELDKLEGFLNELQTELEFDDEFYARLMLTVSEAATNGVVHGNELDESKKVTLLAEYNNSTLVITTQDEGAGFDPDKVKDPLAEENILNTSGRGVFL
ncbi:MAG TPA: ATP-binding protein, partial [Balneola sp.]|nr:ATP-binding protein [Balneola sp.]